MGQGELFALDTATFERLLTLADSHALMELLQEIEGTWDKTHRLYCWKTWPELHKCFTGSLSDPKAGPLPLHECFLGSQYLTDPNSGYLVTLLNADEVSGLVMALESLGPTWLREQCEQLFEGDSIDWWLVELANMLAAVREFYRHAAASSRSVLFTSDERLKDIYPTSAQA
jgi:hypothetical protein